MQSNEDVGKMGISVPFITSKALEMFLEDLVKSTYVELEKSKGSRITADHIKSAIKSKSKFEFLEMTFKDKEI